MPNDLKTRVAKQIAFHGRNIHDVSENAEEFWANTGTDARDIALIQARAVVALVLKEVANSKRPDVSRRYCTNDEAFFNEGFDAALSAIAVLEAQS